MHSNAVMRRRFVTPEILERIPSSAPDALDELIAREDREEFARSVIEPVLAEARKRLGSAIAIRCFEAVLEDYMSHGHARARCVRTHLSTHYGVEIERSTAHYHLRGRRDRGRIPMTELLERLLADRLVTWRSRLG